MKIHSVQVKRTYGYRLDPQRGTVREASESLVRSDVDRIVHNGVTYEVDGDGNFDVPSDVAEFYTRQPDWYEGDNPFPPGDEVVSTPSNPKSKRASDRA
jgi:hypothetical protein